MSARRPCSPASGNERREEDDGGGERERRRGSILRLRSDSTALNLHVDVQGQVFDVSGVEPERIGVTVKDEKGVNRNLRSSFHNE